MPCCHGPHLPGSPWRSRELAPWIAGLRRLGFSFARRFHPIAFRELRVNDQIRIPQVRLFDDETQEAFGIVPLERAKALAVERELDLVEVAPQAQPPVCRLMDYGRFKFEALKRDKESRREHSVVHVKEMKLRPKISEHDFQTKFGYVRQFLKSGDKVKLTIMFRGREMVHQEYGRRLLDRMAEELKDHAIIERSPLVEGRNMIMILSPLAKKPSRGPEGKPEGSDGALHVVEGPVNGDTGSHANGEATTAPAATAVVAPTESPQADTQQSQAEPITATEPISAETAVTTAEEPATPEPSSPPPVAAAPKTKVAGAAKAKPATTTTKPRAKSSTGSNSDAKDPNP